VDAREVGDAVGGDLCVDVRVVAQGSGHRRDDVVGEPGGEALGLAAVAVGDDRVELGVHRQRQLGHLLQRLVHPLGDRGAHASHRHDGGRRLASGERRCRPRREQRPDVARDVVARCPSVAGLGGDGSDVHPQQVGQAARRERGQRTVVAAGRRQLGATPGCDRCRCARGCRCHERAGGGRLDVFGHDPTVGAGAAHGRDVDAELGGDAARVR
jgi:hypothetical protein